VTPRYRVGIDIGSTTIKAVAVEEGADEVVWQEYERHEARQPEKLLEFLRRLEAEIGMSPETTRVFLTGSGGGTLAPLVGARFVQEVVAVSLAVEALHPDAGSVIELGGQDAKIIVFAEGAEPGQRRKMPSMNDRCAGGTGSVIDRIAARLSIAGAALGAQRYAGLPLHPVAGKCGVFAETTACRNRGCRATS
jgi:activator of 2-hydroxyglutaryl-CoA dehydratase